MTTRDVVLLMVGGLMVGLIAVVVDRLNFPQRKFKPKTVALDPNQQTRDRTGAHITSFESNDADEPPLNAANRRTT